MTGGLFSLRLYPRLFKEENFIMKLKKIASLALAGVMAVSMLAGCKGGSTVVGGKDDATVPSIVSAVNNGQSVGNDVKVTFTTDAALENAAKKAVELYQDGASTATNNANLRTAIAQYGPDLLGAENNFTDFYSNESISGVTFANAEDAYDGEKNTFMNVSYVGQSPASDAYIMNAAAAIVDGYVSQLDDTTKVTKEDAEKDPTLAPTEAGDDYFDYSYTGNVCLFSVERSSGVTSYYLATVIEQTVTEKTLEK